MSPAMIAARRLGIALLGGPSFPDLKLRISPMVRVSTNLQTVAKSYWPFRLNFHLEGYHIDRAEQAGKNACCGARHSGAVPPASLEHFRTKWIPFRVGKMRRSKKLKPNRLQAAAAEASLRGFSMYSLSTLSEESTSTS